MISRRAVAAGSTWIVAYNLLWGVAWSLFMRAEWTSATAAVQRRMPWTAGAWHVWVVITIPLGIAIMAYALENPRRYRAAVLAGLTFALFFQAALAIYGRNHGLAWRLIMLDTTVNIAAVLGSGLIAAWTVSEPAPHSACP